MPGFYNGVIKNSHHFIYIIALIAEKLVGEIFDIALRKTISEISTPNRNQFRYRLSLITIGLNR